MLFNNENKKHKEKTTEETRKARSFLTTQANKKKPLIIQTLPTLVLKLHLNSNIYNRQIK